MRDLSSFLLLFLPYCLCNMGFFVRILALSNVLEAVPQL